MQGSLSERKHFPAHPTQSAITKFAARNGRIMSMF